jgi:hypothetical protein
MLNGLKSGSLKTRFLAKRRNAMGEIIKEARQRMKDASRTLPQALGDLELMRFKCFGEGGSGSISELVTAIRLKNGFAGDLKKPMKLEN